jgi:hypothetical protein
VTYTFEDLVKLLNTVQPYDWTGFFGTRVYQEFLAGKRELTCTPWAVPTRNVRGWKAPCYLMTDGHYPTYQEMLAKVDWDKYGVFNGVVRDPRCENCMTHCGYEPSPSLGIDTQRGDLGKSIKYNFGTRPPRGAGAAHVNAYNGVTSGKGHLTGTQVKAPAQNVQKLADREVEMLDSGGRCLRRHLRQMRQLPIQ